MNELKKDQYMEQAPKGTDSTKALGQTAPDPAGNYIAEDGMVIPLGKPKKTGIKSTCSHNEYIVYRVDQVKIRYLLKVKFQFKY